MVKQARGLPNRSDKGVDLMYWVERNFNTDNDSTISALAPDRARNEKVLRNDPELADFHAQAVKWRQNRFCELMEQETFRSLYSRLMMTPPSMPLELKAAGELIDYASRANGQ